MTPTDANCAIEVPTTSNPNLVFVSIATSNYGEVYVTGDKLMPNLVVITFRGTYSAKSAGAYTKMSSLTPIWSSSMEDLDNILGGKNKEEFIFGIYKILMEISHVLMDSICYVAKQINPNGARGSTQLLTTGHSLGGALATIFAYVYVAHITPAQTNVNNAGTMKSYPQLNENIACISLGAPRVFGPALADLFCCLTNGSTAFCNPKTDLFVKNNIVGRITYLRITSFNDPVPSLPSNQVSRFVHPCSSTETLDKREQTNEDCLVQIANSKSTRCASTGRLAMTYDYNLPLNCVDSKDKRKQSTSKSPVLLNFMGYHTQYLGISYIGGISISESIGYEIKRVTGNYKPGDTVCRLIFYPSIQRDMNIASVAFYDLALQRSHGVGENDAQLEQAESTEQEIGLPQTQVTPKASSSQTLDLLKNISGIINKEVKVPEDYLDSQDIFQKLLSQTQTYSILTDLNPPLGYTQLANMQIPGQKPDASFEMGTRRNRQPAPVNKVQPTQIRVNQVPVTQVPGNQIRVNQVPATQTPVTQSQPQVTGNQIPVNQVPATQTPVNQAPVMNSIRTAGAKRDRTKKHKRTKHKSNTKRRRTR